MARDFVLYGKRLCPIWKETLSLWKETLSLWKETLSLWKETLLDQIASRYYFFASLDTVKTIFSRRARQILWGGQCPFLRLFQILFQALLPALTRIFSFIFR